MRIRLLPLAGVSVLALCSAAMAQGLAPRSITLDPITLIAEGTENIKATGGAIVDREDLEAQQPADTSELFARESSVTVSGGAGPSKRIHVFGIEQSKLAVSVDGVPQGPTSWHHTGSNIIDPAFLRAVEVEAGAAAADAGFAAGAGAVRYETLGARDLLTDGRTSGGRVALSYGSNGRGLSGSLASYGVRGALDWFVMLHGQDGRNYKAGDGREMFGSAPAARGGLVKLGFESEPGRLELSYEKARDQADRLIKMNMDLDRDPEVFPLRSDRETLSLTYRATAPGAVWDPMVRLYHSRNDYWRPNYSLGDLAGGKGRINGDMILQRDTFGGVVQNTFTLDQGSVTAGVDFAHNDYHLDNYGDHSAAQPRIRNFSTLQAGAFVQGRFAFDNGFDLSTGLRYDHHRFTDWNNARFTDSGASGNATLSYRFSDAVEVFAGASRSWMGFDSGEYGMLHARNAAFRTDPGYRPATGTTYKLGVNASGEGWTAGATLFDIRLSGLALYNSESGLLENDKQGRSQGVTLTGAWQRDNTRIGATLTHAKVTYDGAFSLPQGGSFMPTGDLATLYVDHQMPDRNLTLGASLEWAGKLSEPAMTAAGFRDHGSYTVVNAYAAWTPPQLKGATLRLGVDNLLDATYYERGSYVERSRGTRDIQPQLAPGRTVTLGLSMNF
ncbi:TonB-dependent receptor domain-containing protein [Paracoccus sp. p3-h83]|uniref:TonB-dependent receptor domain-containing protein n=1 Tax=Paracoccus sp. p3-h83 TaxID=3342805 RepID=UPI0035B85D27